MFAVLLLFKKQRITNKEREERRKRIKRIKKKENKENKEKKKCICYCVMK